MMTAGLTVLAAAMLLGASVLVRAETLTSRRTTAASGNYGRAKTRLLFWGMRFWRWCAWCARRYRQRKALSTLEDCLLDDIGVTRRQAKAEAAKPFWK